MDGRGAGSRLCRFRASQPNLSTHVWIRAGHPPQGVGRWGHKARNDEARSRRASQGLLALQLGYEPYAPFRASRAGVESPRVTRLPTSRGCTGRWTGEDLAHHALTGPSAGRRIARSCRQIASTIVFTGGPPRRDPGSRHAVTVGPCSPLLRKTTVTLLVACLGGCGTFSSVGFRQAKLSGVSGGKTALLTTCWRWQSWPPSRRCSGRRFRTPSRPSSKRSSGSRTCPWGRTCPHRRCPPHPATEWHAGRACGAMNSTLPGHRSA